MKRLCRELEIATFAPSRVHDESVSPAASASLNVMKILLEDLDGEPEVVAQIVETPLVVAEQIDDLLATRLFRRHPEPLDDQTFNVQRSNV